MSRSNPPLSVIDHQNYDSVNIDDVNMFWNPKFILKYDEPCVNVFICMSLVGWNNDVTHADWTVPTANPMFGPGTADTTLVTTDTVVVTVTIDMVAVPTADGTIDSTALSTSTHCCPSPSDALSHVYPAANDMQSVVHVSGKPGSHVSSPTSMPSPQSGAHTLSGHTQPLSMRPR